MLIACDTYRHGSDLEAVGQRAAVAIVALSACYEKPPVFLLYILIVESVDTKISVALQHIATLISLASEALISPNPNAGSGG